MAKSKTTKTVTTNATISSAPSITSKNSSSNYYNSTSNFDWNAVDEYLSIDSSKLSPELKNIYNYTYQIGSIVEIVSSPEFKEMCDNGDDYASTSMPKNWMMSSGRNARNNRIKVRIVGNWCEMYMNGELEKFDKEERKRYFVPVYSWYKGKMENDEDVFTFPCHVNGDKYLVESVESVGEIEGMRDWIDERWIVG